MPQAKFRFTQYYNSFKVDIENLEKLSVAQIQEIELFVSERGGVFDFNSYSFSIQKRLEFHEFVALIKSSSLLADISENIIVRKQEPRVGFGQYKGMQYSELPDAYMLWLKSNYRGSALEVIQAELKRRGL